MLTLPFLFLSVTADIAVISHRGEHLSHPENTLSAYQAAIDAGADYFEVDVRTTSDGLLVVMHDATVDRTTNGHGAVRELTFDAVRALDAGGGARVPTFAEALDLARRGKIGVYVDCKDVSADALVAALGEKSAALVVIYGRPAFLAEVRALRPALRIMPEATSVEVLRRMLEELEPKVIAFDARDFTDEVIRVARDSKADVYVDRLGAADDETHWQHAVAQGATGIQTDHPAELVRYLRARGLHR